VCHLVIDPARFLAIINGCFTKSFNISSNTESSSVDSIAGRVPEPKRERRKAIPLMSRTVRWQRLWPDVSCKGSPIGGSWTDARWYLVTGLWVKSLTPNMAISRRPDVVPMLSFDRSLVTVAIT